MPKIRSQINSINKRRSPRREDRKNIPFNNTDHDFRETNRERRARQKSQAKEVDPNFPKLHKIPTRRDRQAARREFFNQKGTN